MWISREFLVMINIVLEAGALAAAFSVLTGAQDEHEGGVGGERVGV
jgi:hypothetical protein